jgi:hypothetical protein
MFCRFSLADFWVGVRVAIMEDTTVIERPNGFHKMKPVSVSTVFYCLQINVLPFCSLYLKLGEVEQESSGHVEAYGYWEPDSFEDSEDEHSWEP